MQGSPGTEHLSFPWKLFRAVPILSKILRAPRLPADNGMGPCHDSACESQPCKCTSPRWIGAVLVLYMEGELASRLPISTSLIVKNHPKDIKGLLPDLRLPDWRRKAQKPCQVLRKVTGCRRMCQPPRPTPVQLNRKSTRL